jgi:hypothetical protein
MNDETPRHINVPPDFLGNAQSTVHRWASSDASAHLWISRQ